MRLGKVVRGPLTRDQEVETDGAVAVLDPELEVRDGNLLDCAHNKDIPLTLTDKDGKCSPVLDDPKDDHAVVCTKHWVRWQVKNRCSVDRTVEIRFNTAEGSPLEPCGTKKPVKAGKDEDIKCDVRDGTHGKVYGYIILCS